MEKYGFDSVRISELVNVFDFWEELRKLCWNLLIPFRVKIRKPSRQRRKLRRLMLILLWRLGREQYLFKENYMIAIEIKSPRNHLRLQKYLSLWFVKPTALLSFPSNPLVPLLKHLWSLLSAVLVAILWTRFTEPGLWTWFTEHWSEIIELNKNRKHVWMFLIFLVSPRQRAFIEITHIWSKCMCSRYISQISFQIA